MSDLSDIHHAEHWSSIPDAVCYRWRRDHGWSAACTHVPPVDIAAIKTREAQCREIECARNHDEARMLRAQQAQAEAAKEHDHEAIKQRLREAIEARKSE